MKKYITLITSIALLFLSSCEDHLDLTPESYITSGSFWKTTDDAKGAINGLYAQLRNEASFNLFVWGEARSEMMEGSLAGSLGYDRYYNQFLSVNYSGPSWTNLYTLINQCNLAIKYIPNISFAVESEKNNIIAQAYTMRAYAYYTLVRVFGGVPLRLEAFEAYNPATIQLPRTPKDKIFEQIKADIEKASELFPNNNYPSGRNNWSLPALNALKADVYLWTGKVENGGNDDIQIALDALNEVEKSDKLLLPSYSDIFPYSNKGNKEIIMAIRFYMYEASDQSFAHNMYASNTSDFPSYVPQSVKDIVGIPKSGNGNVWRITKHVRDQFTGDDTRKAATYIDVQSADGSQYYTNYGLKFNGMIDLGIRYFLDDWILYRYADILLMKAEAKNALGQDPTTEMELIRKRAYGTNYNSHVFVNGTKEANDDAILKERLFEFSLEGKRWWDLVRFGKAYELVPALQGKEGQIPILWPLSLDALSREPQVGQTPGYETN